MMLRHLILAYLFFFFNDTATTEIYTLSLHDALPISWERTYRTSECGSIATSPPPPAGGGASPRGTSQDLRMDRSDRPAGRSEEHTSELQSRQYLVCRLLLEKKKKKNTAN